MELVIGKYKFYPYDFDASTTPTLEELREMLRRRAEARSEKDVQTPSRSIGQHRPRRKRRG
ncbi:hypothetical protein BH18ACI3_BH18ACI3_11410 [soil metagenome]